MFMYESIAAGHKGKNFFSGNASHDEIFLSYP